MGGQKGGQVRGGTFSVPFVRALYVCSSKNALLMFVYEDEIFDGV